MNSDYSKALNGFHSQLNAFSNKKAEYSNKLINYQDQLSKATQSAKALASSKIIGDGVKGIEGLGAYGAKLLSKKSLKEAVKAGKFKGSTYRDMASNLRGKASDAVDSAGKRLASTADSAGESGASAGAETAEEALAGGMNPFSGGTFEATTAENIGSDAMKGVANSGARAIAGDAGTGADVAETATATLTGDGADLSTDAIVAGGKAVAGSILKSGVSTTGATVGEDLTVGASEAIAPVLEGVGAVLDLVPVADIAGAVLGIAGVAEGGYGAYEAGKGLYDTLTDTAGKALKSAQGAVQRVGALKENVMNMATPTYDSMMEIHSSGAW